MRGRCAIDRLGQWRIQVWYESSLFLMSWMFKRTIQCVKCPWRKDSNPNTIPNGYSVDKHRALKKTIAIPADVLALLNGTGIHVMACHEDHENYCIGWLMNQIGDGNNIPLRLKMRGCTNFRDVRTIGEQHKTLEETLPLEQ